jgi:3-hydroxyisobutyrate dehydrogenase
MAKIAFLGLGVMGAPMAGHLAAKRHDVCVYNRSAVKAEAWLTKHKGRAETTPRGAAEGCDFVVSCVGNDDDLRAITLGPDGAFDAMASGAIFIDHTTASAEVARELFLEAQKRELHFLDAPVSGGQAGAERGTLSIMVGGEQAIFERSQPVLDAYAKIARHMGPAGCGQLAKMVNQICIAGLVQALSEGIHFAECAGLNVEAVMEVISKGAAQSWQMENRWRTMHAREFDFGFAVEWMRKDLGLCKAEASRNGAQLPVMAQVDAFYAEVEKGGGKRWDTSSLITRLNSLKT